MGKIRKGAILKRSSSWPSVDRMAFAWTCMKPWRAVTNAREIDFQLKGCHMLVVAARQCGEMWLSNHFFAICAFGIFFFLFSGPRLA